MLDKKIILPFFNLRKLLPLFRQKLRPTGSPRSSRTPSYRPGWPNSWRYPDWLSVRSTACVVPR